MKQRAPTAGGQYHWVSMLAPQAAQKPLSYATGMSLLEVRSVQTEA